MPRLLSALFVSLILSSSAFAQSDESNAKAKLSEMVQILERCERVVESQYLPRYFVLKFSVAQTQKTLNEKGLGHTATFKAYFRMLHVFKHSESYFGKIETKGIRKDLGRLAKLVEEITFDRGFDEGFVTQVIEDTFRLMKALLEELIQDEGIPNDLRAKVEALISPIGDLLSIAKTGDKPLTFEAADAVYDQIQALRPEFDKVLQSGRASKAVFGIQGLNEYYEDFGQVLLRREKALEKAVEKTKN